ncbi:MAG TPA: hypothetical protein VG320_01800, partial [Paraburkholderia sp.]|uniref:hypothetical protein n=1 Tax=Paraburkholderia sp. TaxID=1926495 RepID=UPI002DF5E9B3|nr:hypothetical protein [Paraburkholderia sp.]
RLILANMPTVITFVSPAQRLSRAFNHVGQISMKICGSSGSVLREHQQFITARRAALHGRVQPTEQGDVADDPTN